jgi:hypothetical protein
MFQKKKMQTYMHGKIKPDQVKQETWQCYETRFSIITIVDRYVVVEIQTQATKKCNYVQCKS